MKKKTLLASLRQSLWFKLTAAFLLVVLVGVGLVALLANQVTTAEFRHYMVQGQLTEARELAEQLADYYAEWGDWTGATEILGQGRGQGRGDGRGANSSWPMRMGALWPGPPATSWDDDSTRTSWPTGLPSRSMGSLWGPWSFPMPGPARWGTLNWSTCNR